MLLTIFSQQLAEKKRNIEENMCEGNLCLDNLDAR